MLRQKSFLTAAVCGAVLAAMANANGQDTTPSSVGQAARNYARLFGQPGTAEYTAALRRGALLVTEELRTEKGDYDPTRSISISAASEKHSSELTLLTIDHDPRYQRIMEGIASEPVRRLDVDDSSRTRMIGGDYILGRRTFSEVALAFEPRGFLNSNGFCSGVLIDRRFVLTAAHCLCVGRIEHVLFGTDLRNLSGSHRAGVRRSKVFANLQCQGSEAKLETIRGRDMAILQLETNVPASVVEQTREIADPDLLAAQYSTGNTFLLVVGFGHTARGDEDRKTKAVVPIISLDCSERMPDGQTDEEFYGCVKDREILARDSKPVGPCPGDSGGGAYLPIKQADGKIGWALVGLVSRSIKSADGRPRCGDGAIYTRLTAEHVQWIRETTTAMAQQ